MNNKKLFVTDKMTPSQRVRLDFLLSAAERHKKMFNPVGYKLAMHEVFTYYYSHDSELKISQKALENKVQEQMDLLQAIKGDKRGKVTLWKILFLLVIGVALAYFFMFLYANSEKYNLNVGVMLIALFAVSGFLIFIPLAFSRRKKE